MRESESSFWNILLLRAAAGLTELTRALVSEQLNIKQLGYEQNTAFPRFLFGRMFKEGYYAMYDSMIRQARAIQP